ncbi:MAG: VPLPA-CTERM sorting domain-containing protein [Gammaproteobacteria bacterium]
MRNVIRILLTTCIMLLSAAANAALIDGTMTISGNYVATASDNNDLMTVTDITLSTVQTTGTATDDFGTTINFFTADGSGGATADLTAFVPTSNFFTYGGWQLDLNTLMVEADSSAGFLHLSGTGIISGNSYQNTSATWSFSAESTTSYSMSVTSVTTVPVPTAVWLFGSGLIGLFGVARRKVK